MLEFCEITGLDRWFFGENGLRLTCQAYPESFLIFKKHSGHASHTRGPVLCWSRINKKERLMRKIFCKIGLVILAIIASLSSSMRVSAAPPVYRSNEIDEVMITRIVPAEPRIELTYSKLGTRGEVETPVYLNLQYGEITDYQLYWLDTGGYAGSTVVARGHMFAMFFWPSFDNGETRALVMGRGIEWGVDLNKNTTHKMHYSVTYANEKQKSRIDYSRCVESQVFKMGLATECRMEYKSNGLVQYQPYTADGVRMELSPEEDARLTEATESWRAEPGDWGPEWYVEPEQPSTEENPNNTEEICAGSGGDDAADANAAADADADADADSNADDADAGGVNVNSDVSGEVAVVKNEAGGSSDPEGVFGDGFFSGLAGTAAIVGGGSSGSGASASDGGGNTSDNESDSNNGGETLDFKNNTDNNVGVPDLGKEEESGPKWATILAISGVAVAGLTSWWFLFFGKYHLKKERRKK